MPQQQTPALDNNFVKGLITEATGLNFPENSVTDTYNCIFDSDGSVYRREGFDFEVTYETKNIDREDKVINTYVWKNVNGDGNATVLVVQIGATLFFYEINDAGNFSQGAVADTVTLTGVSGAPAVETVEAQFSDGNGYLFVTHPYCEPMRISYDIETSNATPENITIYIRDFEGVTPSYSDITNRPTSTFAALPVNHKYNLFNQGWTGDGVNGWDTAQTTMPSLADVMWRFRDTSNNLDFSSPAIARVIMGNTRAPGGHYILALANQDRQTASGFAVTATTTGFQRPSTSAFFAGRLFYSGINYSGFNSNIYFTQIIERDDQYGNAYQVNDPTSEDLFDLLPSDGGVISIPEAGTVYKLFTIPGGLCVFAANGVWFITGSQGIGFTATDYSVQKISNITTLTAQSFTNVAGFPSWWNAEGIYLMQVQNAQPNVMSLTNDKIRTFFQEIPLSSKRNARGFWNATDGHIRWIYKSVSTTNINDLYEFDRILNFNTLTGAFYPWTVSESDVKLHAIISADLISRYITIEDVVDGADDVEDGGEQVIVFSDTGSSEPQFDKYLVSYAEGSEFRFTFADRNNSNFVDWESYDDEGEDYTSYFITGYKIKGGATNRFQNNWVRVYSRTQFYNDLQYYFQSIWDYATTASGTGRWSVNQFVSHDDAVYSTITKRLKVRGRGIAMQFKVTSVPGQAFDVVGWSTVHSVNERP